MIVEFVGVMGAGKTTLHRRALERVEGLHKPVWTAGRIGGLHGRPLRYLFRVRAAWWSRALVFIALRCLGRSGRRTGDKWKGLRWFLTDLGNHWAARRSVPRGHIALFDEGLAQRAMNLFVHGRGTLDLIGIKHYAHAVPPPDALVYVAVDPEIARQRAAERPYRLSRRFRDLDDDQLRHVFTDAARALDLLVDEIRRTHGRKVRIVTIDAQDLESAKLAFDAQLDLLLACHDSTTAFADPGTTPTGEFNAA